MSVTPRVLAGLMLALLTPVIANAALSVPVEENETVSPRETILQLNSVRETTPVRLAQAGDNTFRVGQLEERIRVLNGRIEELSFQLLEMQESLRKMQEDNEFRFQELEGGSSGGRSDAGDTVAQDGNQVAAAPAPVTEPSDNQAGNTLGQVVVDQDGELVVPADPSQDDTQTASLPADASEALYRSAYGHVLSGNYKLAEEEFQTFIAQHPGSQRVPDAHFWLGEALYSQGEYHEAAKTLLTAHKQFPNSPKSPEMLLKLGMSLAALDNRDTACATYREVLTRYPQATDAVKAKVSVEQSRMSC
ncbi:MAG: tol-pal system protein YbgF [Alphaproteobacteria bacterium]|nr:tol-pal system protein YbgF [Alphaproteobacteria bacterium]